MSDEAAPVPHEGVCGGRGLGDAGVGTDDGEIFTGLDLGEVRQILGPGPRDVLYPAATLPAVGELPRFLPSESMLSAFFDIRGRTITEWRSRRVKAASRGRGSENVDAHELEHGLAPNATWAAARRRRMY